MTIGNSGSVTAEYFTGFLTDVRVYTVAKYTSAFVADFTLTDGGSVCLLTPTTREARYWLDENIGEDAIYLGQGLAIERRYVQQIIDGVQADGFEVAL
jgi:hypothetical protein